MEYLSPQALEQFEVELTEAFSVESAEFVGGISDAVLCQNKDLILGFVSMLVDRLPGGWFGKPIGWLINHAAKLWFTKKCSVNPS